MSDRQRRCKKLYFTCRRATRPQESLGDCYWRLARYQGVIKSCGCADLSLSNQPSDGLGKGDAFPSFAGPSDAELELDPGARLVA